MSEEDASKGRSRGGRRVATVEPMLDPDKMKLLQTMTENFDPSNQPPPEDIIDETKKDKDLESKSQ
jgi:hypothetical protein